MKSVTTVLALTICSLFTGASAFAQAPTSTATISFTGFCDGMALTFSGTLVGGTLTGCSTGIAGGNTVMVDPNAVVTGALEATVSSSVLFSTGCLVTYYFNMPAKTWSNYETCAGGVPTIINSGTFTETVPGAMHGPPSSTRR